jgi:hypothetical protein
MTNREPGASRSGAALETERLDSSLSRNIVGLLDSPMSLAQLADDLQVTDARVLWSLTKLEATGRVQQAEDLRMRTQTPQSATAACTVLPGRTVYDYQQAFADARAGMFGSTFVQGSGEHGVWIAWTVGCPARWPRRRRTGATRTRGLRVGGTAPDRCGLIRVRRRQPSRRCWIVPSWTNDPQP